MAELRRLLIDPDRLNQLKTDQSVKLKPNEVHYLKRVLRKKKDDLIQIVDGLGHIWKASFCQDKLVILDWDIIDPKFNKVQIKPLNCLAVVVPKKGFEEVLRMGTEIGVDVFQPLNSDRRVSTIESESKYLRWQEIIREAVEQSERLWKPQLLRTVDASEWIKTVSFKSNSISIGITRSDKTKELKFWLDELSTELSEVWVAIGPEGGWSEREELIFSKSGCCPITIGDSILRTSTAAISAAQLMDNWRRISKVY